MSTVSTDVDTPGPADNPIVPDGPPPPGAEHGLSGILRENLFKDFKNSVLTILFALVLGYCAWRAFGFVFANTKAAPDGTRVDSWRVIRDQLQTYMIGTRFEGTGIGLPMLWAAIYVVVLALGIATGRVPGAATPPIRTRTRLGILLPPLLAVVVVLSMTRTITPTLLVLGMVVPFLAGQALRPVVSRPAVGRAATALVLLACAVVFLLDGEGTGRIRLLAALAVPILAVLGFRAASQRRRAAAAEAAPLAGAAPPVAGVGGLLAALALLAVLLETGGTVGQVDAFGGLLLTVNVAFISIALCFPLGVVLALLRRSTFTLLRPLSVLYIELVRGVPLITLLFMGQFAIGFFLPPSSDAPPDVIRAIIMFTLFSAAYVAEIVRGGLQSVPKGQVEAGNAIGLRPLTITRRIVLPQALRNSIPALVGQFIALLKDTTLLIIIGQFDLLGVSDPILANPEFQNQGYAPEVYAFVGFIFWVICFSMSRASQRLETKLGVGTR
jgi:general L-amino acid transport system permease protein